jgi:hypothetical protein
VASPYRIVVWQLVATLAVAAVLFLWEYPGGDWAAPLLGLPQTVSALAAGMACVAPAGLFAWRAAVERSATRFLLQGVLKFALTLVLIAACIIMLRPAAGGFFGTFALLQAMYVVVPLADGAGSQAHGGSAGETR